MARIALRPRAVSGDGGGREGSEARRGTWRRCAGRARCPPRPGRRRSPGRSTGCRASSASIIRLIRSFVPSDAVKKWLNGTTSPVGIITYFSAVARLTVDSCMPISSPTSARVRGTRRCTPCDEVVALAIDQALGDALDRGATPVDVVDEELRAADVLAHVLLLVLGRLGAAQLRRQAGVDRRHAEAEAARLDDLDRQLAVDRRGSGRRVG